MSADELKEIHGTIAEMKRNQSIELGKRKWRSKRLNKLSAESLTYIVKALTLISEQFEATNFWKYISTNLRDHKSDTVPPYCSFEQAYHKCASLLPGDLKENHFRRLVESMPTEWGKSLVLIDRRIASEFRDTGGVDHEANKTIFG